jgi:hypothetical protein
VEVDLVTVEVEQLGVDGGRAGLPRGLHDQPGDGLTFVDQDGWVTTRHPRRLEILRILDLHHDRRPVTGVGQRRTTHHQLR